MGSKARIAKYILPIILKNKKESQFYIEPFAGGMNTICLVKGKRIANDSNYYLVEMWKALIDGWMPKKISREEYHEIKNNINNYPSYLVGWVGFNCSYSGKWFGGFAGETKTKIGTVRDYQNEAIKNVLKQKELMNGVIFSNKSYEQLEIPDDSIIYCDPPYKGTTGYSDKINYTYFWEWVRKNASHSTIFVSEYAAPEDFVCVWDKDVKSSLSANGKYGGNKISTEKLFIYENSI